MKNMDPLNDNIISLLQNSSDNFVSLLWKDSGMVTLSLNGLENHSLTPGLFGHLAIGEQWNFPFNRMGGEGAFDKHITGIWGTSGSFTSINY